MKMQLNTPSYYIKETKWAEFRVLHLSRFRYQFDEKKNRYFRKMRLHTIFVDAETRHIYQENIIREPIEVASSSIEKLLNREMIEKFEKTVDIM